jgi:murein DD-endopeptidase MepM/ murein hydrolase activator NlpD
MSMKSNVWLRTCCLLILLVSMIPVNQAVALAASAPPPVDMFQLPWDQGIAWYAIDGIDNGTKRPASSSHNYRLGGAIDFAPRLNMVTGENTSNYWVTAAAAGTVVATATCYVTLSHANGWVTQYQFLGNIQVRLGDVVARNQRLGIIADGVRYRYCPGYEEINIPHVHFMLRPSMIDATFAGWQVKYNSFFNSTTFTKNGITLGLNRLLMNTMDAAPTPTPPAPPTATPTNVASPTPTLSGPYVSTIITPQSIAIGSSALVTVRLNNVPTEGYTSAEFTCTYNANLFEVSNISVTTLFGADPVSAINGPQAQRLIVAIAGSDGNKATASGAAFTFDVRGLQPGQTVIECRARVSQGNNLLTEIPFVVDYLTIQGGTPTQSLTPSSTPTIMVPPASPTSTAVVPSASPTPFPTFTPGGNWLTYINSRYGFMFGYPGQLLSGNTDNYARIDLPFVQGTNLREKYLEVSVVENFSVCQSPLPSQTSETVIISGLTFLKQTGAEGAAGNFYDWVSYSTSRNNVCVSLDFVLHSVNAGNFPTPPPLFDFAAESAVFGQIVSTYSWLPLPGTPSPTFTPATPLPTTPAASFTPTPTINTTMSPTPGGGNGAITGTVLASKPVTVNVYDANNVLVATVQAQPSGSFQLEVPPGNYTVIAMASGFLRAQAGVPNLNPGVTRILGQVILPAGDIDANNVIDQFDVLTIGMNYNLAAPAAADLNNDGTINVLDLEALARNYRKTGPIAWQ